MGETERRLKSKRSLDYIHNELEKRRKSLRARGDAVAVMNQSSHESLAAGVEQWDLSCLLSGRMALWTKKL